MLYNAFKGGLWLGLAQICGVVAGLGVHAAIARWAPGNDALGQYALVVSWSLLAVGTLTLPGLGGAVQQSVARGYDGALREAYRGRWRFSWIGTGAMLMAGGVYYTLGEKTVSVGLTIPALILPWIAAGGSCVSYFRGRSLFSLSARWEAGARVLNAVCIAAVLYFTGNIVFGIWAYFAAMMIGNLVGHIWAKSLCRNQNVDDGFLRFGYHLSAMSLFSILELHGDRIILGGLTSIEVVSIYTAAGIIHNQLRLVVVTIGQVFHPSFCRCEGVRPAVRLLGQIFVPVVGVVTAFILVLWYFAPAIVRIVYHDRYPQAEALARILILSAILFTPSILIRSLLTAQRCVAHLYVYDIAFPVVQVVGWTVGARFFGLDGMVWARVLVLALGQVLVLGLLFHAMRSGSSSVVRDTTGAIEDASPPELS
jgi:O-antigen/teichoic acid export membrane protein